jgi:pyruvate dehydrogenase E1 component alpha subunit
MDPQAVLRAAEQAVARGRAGAGPTFLECVTYRFDAHHTWEHKARVRYRSDSEVTQGRSRDPQEIQGSRLAPQTRTRIDAEVEALLVEAVEFARAAPRPDPAEAMAHLYASGPCGRDGTGERLMAPANGMRI